MRVEPFDTQRQLTFSRRATVFTGGTLVLFGGLGYRLFQLQVQDHEQYRALADDNRFNQRILMPLRGVIYDRFGVPLATNRQNFQLLLVPEKTQGVEETLSRLQSYLEISESKKESILREVRRKRAFTEIEIANNLSWEEFSKINFALPNFPGVLSRVGATRSYPLNDATAFVVGYVGAPSESDLNAQEEALWLRYPAISPDGNTIVFSYKGDLFTVPTEGGVAYPLTLNEGRDFMPVWSHDGTQIAFASGFQTIRQFNGTFRKLYGRSPGQLLRRNRSRVGARSLCGLEFRTEFISVSAAGRFSSFTPENLDNL